MKTLIIDTSTDKSLVLLTDGVQIIFKKFLPEKVQSSKLLIQEIDRALKMVSLLPTDIEAVAVAVGPGSYTGVRVGVAVAKGFAFPKGLPLVGFCSLEGFVSDEEGEFASVIDARVGGAYVLMQRRDGEDVRVESEPRFLTYSELEGLGLRRAGPEKMYPNAEHLSRVVAKKLSDWQGNVPLELVYLRTPEYTLSRPIPPIPTHSMEI